MPSLAQYADTQLIETIQALYSSDLDVSTTVADASGAVQLLKPTNLTHICQQIVRCRPAGVLACQFSDANGAELLRELIEAPSRTPVVASTVKYIRQVSPEFAVHGRSFPPVAVAYRCIHGFLDFAVPVLNPAFTLDFIHNRTASQRPSLISIAYGGQYLEPTSENRTSLDLNSIKKSILGTLTQSNTFEEEAIDAALALSRTTNWHEVVLSSHVMFALLNAVAAVGLKSGGEPLKFSKENVFQIYTTAFSILAGGADGCVLTFNKYRNTFEFGCKCENLSKGGICHKDVGTAFARIRNTPALDKILCQNTATDPWFVGRCSVKQNHVFAIRKPNRDLLGVANVNVESEQPPLSELCTGAMLVLARQLASFIQQEPLLSSIEARTDTLRRIDSIARDPDADSVGVCKEVAKTLCSSDVHCAVWLLDEADLVEKAVGACAPGDRAASFLTCYAVDYQFPEHYEVSSHFPDIRADLSAIRSCLESANSIVPFPALTKNFPEFADSDVFRQFIRQGEESHWQVLLVPIVGRDGTVQGVSSGESPFLGLLVLFSKVTTCFTEGTRQEVLGYSNCLYEFLNSIAARSKARIQAGMKEIPFPTTRLFSRRTFHAAIQKYLSLVLEKIVKNTKCQGVSIYLRQGFPAEPVETEGVVLYATANKANGKPDGSYDISHTMVDKENKLDLTEGSYGNSTYEPGAGCTGFLLAHSNPSSTLWAVVPESKTQFC